MILKEIAVRLGLDLDSASFAEGAGAVELVKAGLEAIVKAAEQVAETFVEAIKSTAEYGDQVIELAAATGVGTASLQHLAAAAVEDGIGLDELSHALILLTRQMSSAKGGSEETAKAFKDLGVRVTDLTTGKLRPTEDVLIDISEKFSKMKDGGEKVAASLKIFGRSGASLIDFLNKGRDAFEEYFAASVVSDEELEAGKRLVEIQRALTFQTQQLWRSGVAPLLPAIKDLLEEFYAWKKANAEVLKQNITAFIGTGVTIVKALGKAFQFAIGTIKFFKDNWVFLKGVLLLSLPIIISLLIGWAGANSVLIGQWIVMGTLATAAATTAAAAWLVAAAPFLIIGGIVAGLLLLFDDLREYSESVAKGGHGLGTAFGRFNQQLANWSANSTGQDPWWLKALYAARDTMKELIFLYNEWTASQRPNGTKATGAKFSGKETIGDKYLRPLLQTGADIGSGSTENDPGEIAVLRKLLGYGSRAALGVADLFGGGAPNFTPAYAGAPALSGPGFGPGPESSSSRSIGTLSFVINGGDPNEVRRVIGEVLSDGGYVGHSELESTKAAASSP